MIEGYWDCSYCGNKAIRGGVRVCPNCGKTRAADVKFYMRETTPVADDAEVDTRPDWFCPYCDSYNPASETVCRNCGHEREAEDQDYFAVREDEEEKQAEADAQFAALTGAGQASPARTRSGSRRIISIVLILALILTGVYLMMPKERAFTVVSKTWQRSVEVEAYRVVQDSGWSVPSDALEVVRSSQEIHHYDQILDHYEEVERSRQVLAGYDTYYTYEDMGNGYFDEVEHETPRYETEYYTEEVPVYVSVPVYATKYYYNVNRWVYDRTETASGADEPYWPDSGLGSDERTAGRQERYTVVMEDAKGRQAEYVCSLDIWNALTVGKGCDVMVQSGQILEIR